jgi:hypothetical protein
LKKNRQQNDQKKKYKRTNNDLQNIHIKLKIGYTNPPKNKQRSTKHTYKTKDRVTRTPLKTNNDLQNIHIKLKIGYTNPTKNKQRSTKHTHKTKDRVTKFITRNNVGLACNELFHQIIL